LTAAKELGWTHLAAVMSGDGDAALREFALQDNRTAEMSTWDHKALMAEIDELDVEALDLGWNNLEVANIVKQAEADADLSGDVDLDGNDFGNDKAVNQRFMVTVPIEAVKAYKVAFKEHLIPLNVLMRPVK